MTRIVTDGLAGSQAPALHAAFPEGPRQVLALGLLATIGQSGRRQVLALGPWRPPSRACDRPMRLGA